MNSLATIPTIDTCFKYEPTFGCGLPVVNTSSTRVQKGLTPQRSAHLKCTLGSSLPCRLQTSNTLSVTTSLSALTMSSLKFLTHTKSHTQPTTAKNSYLQTMSNNRLLLSSSIHHVSCTRQDLTRHGILRKPFLALVAFKTGKYYTLLLSGESFPSYQLPPNTSACILHTSRPVLLPWAWNVEGIQPRERCWAAQYWSTAKESPSAPCMAYCQLIIHSSSQIIGVCLAVQSSPLSTLP